MLTLETFNQMSASERDSCTFVQLIEMYLITCQVDPKDLEKFFNSLSPEDCADLTESINGRWKLLEDRAYYIFQRASLWSHFHHPKSSVTLTIDQILINPTRYFPNLIKEEKVLSPAVYEDMSQEEKDNCTLKQLVEMYLFACCVTLDDLKRFFRTLSEEDLAALAQPVNDDLQLLKVYQKKVFEKALSWINFQRPNSLPAINIANALKRSFS